MKERRSVAWPAGLKQTQPRRRVLNALENATGPMTAMEIYSKLQGEQGPIWLSTIYRVLDTFTEKGLVVRTDVQENGMAVYELSSHRHKHYAVCVGCHRVIPLESCPLETFVPSIRDGGFHVLGHKLEVYGYCKQCGPGNGE